MSKLSNTFTKVYKSLSGICNHMIFETKYVKEIIDIVELTHHDKFYNIFIKNTTEIHGSGASEYEIYFTPFCISNAENVSPSSLKTPPKVGVSNDKWCNYMLKYHKNEITIRKLNYSNTIDNITLILNGEPNDFDYVSYHYYNR